jgi:hypothetical protein
MRGTALPVDDTPKVWPAARGIITTTYDLQTKGRSTARFYHDCGGEWVITNETDHEVIDGSLRHLHRYRCAGCRAYGRHETVFPVEVRP